VGSFRTSIQIINRETHFIQSAFDCGNTRGDIDEQNYYGSFGLITCVPATCTGWLPVPCCDRPHVFRREENGVTITRHSCWFVRWCSWKKCIRSSSTGYWYRYKGQRNSSFRVRVLLPFRPTDYTDYGKSSPSRLYNSCTVISSRSRRGTPSALYRASIFWSW